MLRKIKLYGRLKDFIGVSVLEAEVNNAGEAIRFLLANWPELTSHMANQYYQVDVGASSIPVEELSYPAGSDDIKIIPVVGGGGNVGRIILGAVLIGVAIMNPAVGFGLGPAGLAGGFATASGAFSFAALAGNIGIALVLSGVAGLLAPIPEVPDNEADPENSFSFNGVQQTSRSGTAIPVIYGEVITGSVVVSAKVDINDEPIP